MTSPPIFLPAALAIALVLGAQRNAGACFDEHVSQAGPVRISVSYRSENGGRLRCGKDGTPCATWAARLARLLPRGARLEVRSGWEVAPTAGDGVEVELCLPRRTCQVTESDHDEIADVFDEIAARLATPAARRARIRRSRVAYFTLQAGAFARREAADALATRIDEEAGDFEADVTQGHPGPKESSSWVEEAAVRGGRRVFRVMTGSFAGHADAVRARARVAATTGETPLVRPLGADGA